MRINIHEIEKLRLEALKDHVGLGKVINPILEQNSLSYNELVEVCQIGKFVYKIDSNLSIIDKPKPPSPDFILWDSQKIIGLEHTRIQTEDAYKYNRVKTLLNFSEELYKKKYPKEIIRATISFKDDNIEYKPSDKKEIALEIAETVYNYHKGINTGLPSYLTFMKTYTHSKFSFSYKENKWEGPYLTKERMEVDILKKERKIDLYKYDKAKLDELWLTLLIGSLNSASYQYNELEDYTINSKFDRVYLMTDFKAQIFRLK